MPPKIWRNPKLDKVFDELRPETKALIDAGEFGKPLNESGEPLLPIQQSQKQLQECLHHCQQMIEYYRVLANIYQGRLSQLSESSACSPSNTSKTKK